MEQKEEIEVLVAGPEHEVYVDTILQTIADAAKVRGTGIAKRTHEYLATKMKEAKAVIAEGSASLNFFSVPSHAISTAPEGRLQFSGKPAKSPASSIESVTVGVTSVGARIAAITAAAKALDPSRGLSER